LHIIWTVVALIHDGWRWSYTVTDGQSASLSWYQAPTWGSWPDFNYCQMWSFFSSSMMRRWVCNLLIQVPLSVVSNVTLGSKSRRIYDHI
jgi:hypothetical protein